jgi:hypothetical protein
MQNTIRGRSWSPPKEVCIAMEVFKPEKKMTREGEKERRREGEKERRREEEMKMTARAHRG